MFKAMKRLSILFCVLSLCLTGCVSTAPPNVLPYANNPFNIIPYKSKTRSTTSPSDVARAANIGLNAASRPIAGAISPGAASGISSGLFVLNLLKGQSHIDIHKNGIGVRLPLTMATNVNEAESVIFNTITKSIIETLPAGYSIKKVTYQDKFKETPINREWYLVNGPQCENWSCQFIPLLMQPKLFNQIGSNVEKDDRLRRYVLGYVRVISLVKITKDFIDEGKNYRFRVVEGTEIPSFNYIDFYEKISRAMPKWAWVFYHKDGKYQYAYQGKSFPSGVKGEFPLEIP